MFEAGRRTIGWCYAPLWVCMLLLGGAGSVARAGGVSESLTPVLEKLPKGAQAGLVVANADTGEVLFEQAADIPLKPASVLKLFTTAAALDRLGADFRYRTNVYLNGDELWVIGAGDPSLGDQRLNQRHGKGPLYPFDYWAELIAQRGDVHIAKIVLDDSLFEQRGRNPDWPDDQASAWYQAPVGALVFNDNCVDAWVAVNGREASLRLQPPLPDSFVRNNLRVGGKHRPVVRRAPGQDIFSFEGTVTRDDGLGSVAVGQPTVYFGHALRETLAARGIANGAAIVRRDITAAARGQATLLTTYETPLAEIVWRCNTFSQNLFAECLLKSLAAYGADGKPTGAPGSWTAGAAQARQTLESLGVRMNGAEIRDGSGLSHENHVTARQIAMLLTVMNRHPARAVFRESLAEPGEDGSMRRHYDSPELHGRLFAKTGTIRETRALAGYATAADGTTLAFAFLCNGSCSASVPVDVAVALVRATATP